jgi:ribose 1,5-bisphosphokinase
MAAGAGTGLIGPGRLVVVVGPSGAGKDTLIAGARLRLAGDPTIVFPLRIVTRTASAAEHHQIISDRDFATAAEAGAFAVWWEAHGLKYALPAGIDDDIRAGRTVVCNVSRGIVGRLRRRYAHLGVGRASDGDIAQRIGRMAPPDAELSPDQVIENVGDLERGTASLVAAIFGAARLSGGEAM